jgi:hypothetical protein
VCWLRSTSIHLFLDRWRRTSERSRLVNHNGVIGTIVRIGRHHTHALHDTHSTINTTKDGMLAVQPRRRFDNDKELRPVGIGTGIRHGDDAGARVFEIAGNFVFKLALVNGFATPSRAGGIAALNHKVANDAVKYRAVVVAGVGERGNIVAGARSVLVIQFDAKGSLRILLLCLWR